MEDQFRVTVIATGFGKYKVEEKKEFKNIRTISNNSILDTPTHVRMKKINEPDKKIETPNFFPVEDEYDTPTFLRRAAD